MVLDRKQWKKLEDDIIKAGVMKYGTSKWSKISTLLQNKTPRECKERWSLISPANTNFSKEEVLQLLDLVKALPNQWIAISRFFKTKSPHQCYEAYQRIMVGEARKSSKISINEIEHLALEKKADSGGKRVFNKETGSFDITKPEKACFLKGNRLLRREEMDYSGMEDEEKDLVDVARARLQNTKGRKDLKKAMVRKREEHRRLERRTRHTR